MAKKKKSATGRILLVIGGLLVVLVVALIAGKAAGFLGQQETGMAVEIDIAEPRAVTQVVTATGKVQPEIEVSISPEISGEIIDLRVKEGERVRQGDLLVRIKADFYVAQVEQAQANVLQSKAALAQRRADKLNAELEFNRQKELFEKNVISESDYQRADTQYEVAKAAHEGAEYSVQNAEARLNEAKEQLAKTSIRAPMDGTISILNVELGERVLGTSQMQGTELMRIARLNQMELEVDVNENDVVNVAVGDTAAIEVDAYPERVFKGLVTEIANSARSTGVGTQEQVTNFPVKIRILDAHNDDYSLLAEGQKGQNVTTLEQPQQQNNAPNFRPGMSGTVDIFTHTVFNAVAVPIQAVTVRDFNTVNRDRRNRDSTAVETEMEENTAAGEDLRRVVFVMNGDSKAEMVEVETGISDDTHIVVKVGLVGGEKVIIGPFRAVSRTLRPDMQVREEDENNQSGRFTASR